MLARIVRGILEFGGFGPGLAAPPRRPVGASKRISQPAAAPARPGPKAQATVRSQLRFGLHTATVRYSRAINSNTWDVVSRADRDQIIHVMGRDLAAWQRALRLTWQMPWRSAESMPEPAARALVRRQWLSGLDTWEAALKALDRQNALAADLGKPQAEPLHLPAEVDAALSARRTAALERAQRRARRTASEGEGAPAVVPAEEVAPPLGPRR